MYATYLADHQCDPDRTLHSNRPFNTRRRGLSLTRTYTRYPNTTAMNTGFGGFDNPLKRYSRKLFCHIVHRHLPNSRLPRAMSLKSTRRDARAKPHPPLRTTWRHPSPGHEKDVDYISFDAVVGRNSKFVNLTSGQRDELGGVEYRVSEPFLGDLPG